MAEELDDVLNNLLGELDDLSLQLENSSNELASNPQQLTHQAPLPPPPPPAAAKYSSNSNFFPPPPPPVSSKPTLNSYTSDESSFPPPPPTQAEIEDEGLAAMLDDLANFTDDNTKNYSTYSSSSTGYTSNVSDENIHQVNFESSLDQLKF